MSKLLTPVLTEKSMRLAADGVYVFEVSPQLNKLVIAEMVKTQFKVDPVNVRISITKGKLKKFKGVTGKRKDIKKAYVTLKKGQTISALDFNEGDKK